jgi:hypothetical protein
MYLCKIFVNFKLIARTIFLGTNFMSTFYGQSKKVVGDASEGLKYEDCEY